MGCGKYHMILPEEKHESKQNPNPKCFNLFQGMKTKSRTQTQTHTHTHTHNGFAPRTALTRSHRKPKCLYWS